MFFCQHLSYSKEIGKINFYRCCKNAEWVSHLFQLMPRSEEDETYWKVKEEALDGVCEATYQVSLGLTFSLHYIDWLDQHCPTE